MCWIYTCFAWSLDLIQRIITFCLACCIVAVITFGLIITVAAGIAYGYNYSLAEFITLKRIFFLLCRDYLGTGFDQFLSKRDFDANLQLSAYLQLETNVTVYMRHSKFEDNLELRDRRRMDAGDDDSDFALKWFKNKDIADYARKRMKYTKNKKLAFGLSRQTNKQQERPSYTIPLPATRRMSKIPNLIPTTVWISGTSEIVMRKFLPLTDITEKLGKKEPNDYAYRENENNLVTVPSDVEYSERQVKPIRPDNKLDYDDISERNVMPINNNSPTISTNIEEQDDPLDEGEESVIYKPV